ncbi:MAG TPA: hypothetical protein ENK88_05270 [Campylobacterales bacterium]|nr:hypothetical protein [Campylobacterales bacterium]
MKKILISLILLSSYLFSSYLIVGDSSGLVEGAEDEIRLNPISINFANLEVSSSGSFIEIPIYVKSDTTEAVTMKLTNITPLVQGSNSIGLSLSYRGTTISDNVPFNLLNNGEGGRDGNTVVGKIKVTIPTVSSTQNYGNYSTSIDMELSSSSTEHLNITATVPLVAVAGFEPVDSYTKDKKFIGATLHYGTFNINQKNSIEKNLFIRSNSSQNFRMTFDTSELVSQIDSSYTIPLSYYYNNIPFTNNNTFIALNGKNEGNSNIGTVKFETGIITGSLIAGDYQATIGITVTLE